MITFFIIVISLSRATANSFFLTYNSILINNTLDISRFKLINEHLLEQSNDFIHNINTSHYARTLFTNIVQDCDIIQTKLDKISNNRGKRALINLGYFSESLGIASMSSIEDIRKKFDSLHENYKKDSVNTQRKIDNLLSQTLILKRWIEIGKNSESTNSKLFFFYLKFNKIAQHLILNLQEIELAHLSNLLGNTQNFLLDSEAIEEEIIRLTPPNALAIRTSKQNLTWEIRNDIIIQTMTIPLVYKIDICDEKNGTLHCKNRNTPKPKNCLNFEKNSLLCNYRPCFSFNKKNIKCKPISKNSFLLEAEIQTPCELIGVTYKNHILINKKQVLYIDSLMSLHCNDFLIPKCSLDTINEKSHLLLNFTSDILSDIKNQNLTQHPIYDEMSKFINLTKETTQLSNGDKLFVDHTKMQIISLSHTSIAILLLIAGIITFCVLKMKKKLCVESGVLRSENEGIKINNEIQISGTKKSPNLSNEGSQKKSHKRRKNSMSLSSYDSLA